MPDKDTGKNPGSTSTGTTDTGQAAVTVGNQTFWGGVKDILQGFAGGFGTGVGLGATGAGAFGNPALQQQQMFLMQQQEARRRQAQMVTVVIVVIIVIAVVLLVSRKKKA